MRIEDLKEEITGVIIFTYDAFQDDRGSLWTVHKDGMAGLPPFVQDKVSVSKANVLRGLHGDPDTGKLITCLSGECFLVVVDARPESRSFMKHVTIVLSGDNRKSVYVPPGCLNGHAVTSVEDCVFFYKWTRHYTHPSDQLTVSYRDPDLSIQWPISSPILSERDRIARTFKEVICR